MKNPQFSPEQIAALANIIAAHSHECTVPAGRVVYVKCPADPVYTGDQLIGLVEALKKGYRDDSPTQVTENPPSPVTVSIPPMPEEHGCDAAVARAAGLIVDALYQAGYRGWMGKIGKSIKVHY